MSVDLREYWDEAVPFERWLDGAEANVELWRSIYERADVPDQLLEEDVVGPYRLLVLSEDWCGDAVNSVPWLARLAERMEGWELRMLDRDENLELMAEYTTNGSLSIPVVIVMDAEYREVAWWGPRPEELQAWVLEEGLGMDKTERYKRVRRWYARDRGRTTIEEVMRLLGLAVPA